MLLRRYSGQQRTSIRMNPKGQPNMDYANTKFEAAPRLDSDSLKAPVSFTIGACWLGAVLVAASGKGICAILLGDDSAALRHELEERFLEAAPIGGDPSLEPVMEKVVRFIEAPGTPLDLPLDPHGSAFELRVWEALREIPPAPRRATARSRRTSGRPGRPTPSARLAPRT